MTAEMVVLDRKSPCPRHLCCELGSDRVPMCIDDSSVFRSVWRCHGSLPDCWLTVAGMRTNGVLLLHGTAGSAADLVQANFFDALYGAGEPLRLGRHGWLG